MGRKFYIRISAFVCVLLGLAVAGGIRLSGQTTSSGAHADSKRERERMRRESNRKALFSFQLRTTLSAESEPVSPPPPTRSSFMATWKPVSGANGYLLDVSTSSAFDNYVDGYHDLDVGDATGRVVTGLNRGTTYYYRVRAYDVRSMPVIQKPWRLLLCLPLG